jgi:predicted  nucleic acid-binding Zn-ribbon protein
VFHYSPIHSGTGAIKKEESIMRRFVITLGLVVGLSQMQISSIQAQSSLRQITIDSIRRGLQDQQRAMSNAARSAALSRFRREVQSHLAEGQRLDRRRVDLLLQRDALTRQREALDREWNSIRDSDIGALARRQNILRRLQEVDRRNTELNTVSRRLLDDYQDLNRRGIELSRRMRAALPG